MKKELSAGTNDEQRTIADLLPSASVEASPMLPAVSGVGEELANWIYWEENNDYYCFQCIEKRLEEINTNREFSESIDYENGDTCGYYQDYADSGDDENPEQEYCCKCYKPLFTIGVD